MPRVNFIRHREVFAFVTQMREMPASIGLASTTENGLSAWKLTGLMESREFHDARC